MDNKIARFIQSDWFLTEPALFQTVCTHKIVENENMHCPIRCGERRIEYNPKYTGQMSDQALKELFKNETIRILLKHPYSRIPEGCSRQAIKTGSDLVIGDNYSNGTRLNLETPERYELEKNQSYGWYSHKIQERMDNGQIPSNRESAEQTELWKENTLVAERINNLIRRIAQSERNWGSLKGNLQQIIIASTRAKVNWRNILAGFRSSIISSRTVLSRMKPNRRSGFDQMGRRREYDTRLLIAVDVSGSITDESLSDFYGIMKGAFRQGVETIDVLQFDCGISETKPLNSKPRKVQITGRGGTSFQEPIDYAFRNRYDGLLILTDGYAPKPTIPQGRTRLMWICNNETNYESNHEWMKETGRVCRIELA